MYSINRTGITKKLETWQLIIPLVDNSGNKFSQSQIDNILEDIATSFPGYTVVNCLGFWKDQTQTYKDDNLQVIIDTLPSVSADTISFFSKLKDQLCETLLHEVSRLRAIKTSSISLHQENLKAIRQTK